MRLRHAATNAHVEHLRTRSYAAHKSLQEFYEEVVEVADRWAEAAQGAAGAKLVFDGKFTWPESMPTMLFEIKEWVDDHRLEITKESHLLNILDEVKELMDSTMEHLTRV